MNDKQFTSGDLFLRHFLIGILVIAVIIFSSNSGLVIDPTYEYSSLITAGIIAIINGAVIVSFTYLTLNDELLLAEEDSPDHAYYLGFCLTLATLALIFFTEAAHPTGASGTADSKQIQRALTQFAAGLFATLLGLTARIFLSSKQNISQKEPGELINLLRLEVDLLSTELKESRRVYTAMLQDLTKGLKDSFSKLDKEADNLSEVFVNSSTTLKESLGATKISEQSKRFIGALENLNNSLVDQSTYLIDNLKELTGNTSALTDDMAKTTANLNEVNNSVSGFSTSLNHIAKNDIPQISTSSEALSRGLNEANLAIGQTSNQLSDQIQSLSRSIQQSNQAISGFNDQFKYISASDLNNELKAASRAIAKLTNDISELNQKLNQTPEQVERGGWFR